MGAVVHIYHPSGDEIRELLLQSAPGRQIVVCRTDGELRSTIGDVEVLLTGRLPRDVLVGAGQLRWIQHMGAGVDSLLPAPGLPERVQITCTRGLYAPQVAEHAIALLLALHRGLPAHFASQLENRWRPFAATPLAGKTLTVVGLGEIGSRVVRIAAGMSMRIFGVSRTARPTPDVDRIFASADLRAALASSEALVVTVPLTMATRHMIGAAELAAMPRRALVVNVGRGGLIDEQALLAALGGGEIGGAALDVFETEPLPPGSPWWRAPNTIVTPHCSGTTVNHRAGICAFFARNLARYDAGEPLLNLVDRDLGY